MLDISVSWPPTWATALNLHLPAPALNLYFPATATNLYLPAQVLHLLFPNLVLNLCLPVVCFTVKVFYTYSAYLYKLSVYLYVVAS